MKATSGGLSFDITGNSDQLKAVLEETKKSIQTFTTEVERGGQGIDQAFNKAAATINEGFAQIDRIVDMNKASLTELRQEYDRLGQEIAAAYNEGRDADMARAKVAQDSIAREIRMRDKIIQQAEQTADELLQEEQAMKRQEEQANRNANAQQSIRTQLRQAREELVRMEEAGLRGTEAYREMQLRAGALRDALDDAGQQMTVLASDTQNIDSVMSGISGLTGAFTAAQGAMALFTGENENLQKVMLKVQSLMSITMGLQQVSNALNKDSAFQLVLVAKAKEALAVATTKLSVALGISNVAAKALMATLTLGLSVAITALIVAFDRMMTKQKQAKKAQEDFNAKVADAAGKPLEAYISLQTEYNSLTGTMKEKQKFIEDNADRFADLGFEVNNVNDAEDILIRNSKNVIEALTLRAKATATSELAVAKYKEVIEAQNKLDATPKAYVTEDGTYTDGYGVQRKGKVLRKDKAWQDAEDEVAKKTAEYNELIKQQTSYVQQGQALIQQIGHNSNQIIEGSVQAAEKQLQKLRDQYNRAATDQERQVLAGQIAAQEKKVKALAYQAGSSGGGTTKTGRTDKALTEAQRYLQQLEKIKEQYEEYNKYVASSDAAVRSLAPTQFADTLKGGETYLQYLENQRAIIEAKAKKTGADLEHLEVLNNEIANTAKSTALQDFTTNLQQAIDQADTLAQKLEAVANARKELQAQPASDLKDEQTSALDEAERSLGEEAIRQSQEIVKAHEVSLNERAAKERDYVTKIQALEYAITHATSDAQRERLEHVKSTLQQIHQAGIASFEELDQIYNAAAQNVEGYEQTRAAIIAKYDLLIQAARIKNDKETEQALQNQMQVELLKADANYKTFFGDIATMSAAAFEKVRGNLILMAKQLRDQGKITAEQYKQLMGQIAAQTKQMYSQGASGATSIFGKSKAGGIFNFLFGGGDLTSKIDDLKESFSDVKDSAEGTEDAMEGTADDAGKTSDSVKKVGVSAEYVLAMIGEIVGAISETLGAVSDTLNTFAEFQDSMGNSGAAESLSDIASVIGAFDEGISSIFKNGNIIGAIGSVISAPLKVMTVFNKIHDKKYEKRIKEQEKAVKALSNAYNQLAHEIDNALGEDTYKLQNQSIQNLRNQNAIIQKMIKNEEDKKKTDWDRIADWKEQIAENNRTIDDAIKQIAEEITGTSGKSLAESISGLIQDSFTSGAANSKQAVSKIINQTLADAITSALQKKFLEKQLAEAVTQLQRDMGFDDEGNGTFDGLTQEEQDRFKKAVSEASANFQQAMEVYQGLFDQLNENDPTTLSGAIKGASQESIGLLAGQADAVRVNQVETLALFRQQLAHVSNIDTNLGAIYTVLNSIYKRITTPADDGLRGQGITG